MNNQLELINSLNDILQFLIDSKLCFSKHIENVNNKKLKILFSNITNSREQMIADIKKIMKELGERPSETGTLLGKTHMIFENIKSLLTNGDPLVITKEVRRGEGVLIEYYKNALALDPPDDIKNLLLTHLNKIQDDVKEADLLSVTT